MARMVQDQNLNIHSAGSLAAMFDGSKTSKKGALGGRKALNDISNSSKLSKNVITKGKDFITAPGANVDKVSKPRAPASGRKALGDLTNTNFARSTTQNGLTIPSDFKDEQFRAPASGRKALGDLTNKKVQDRKLSGIMEGTIPSDFKDEQFLHNHEECIKVQRKGGGMQFKHFMETVGLGSPLPPVPQAPISRAESPVKMINWERKEMPEFSDKDQIWTVYSSPPKSMTAFDDNWKIADDETFIEFRLIESPKLHNY